MPRWFRKCTTKNKFLILSLIIMIYWCCSKSVNESKREAKTSEEKYNLSDFILPEYDTTLVDPNDICQRKWFLLIAVCSNISNYDARQTIRQTWGNVKEFNYDLFAKIHSHLKGKYLAPLEERIEFYDEYLFTNINHAEYLPSKIPIRLVFIVGRADPDDPPFFHVTDWQIAHEAHMYKDIVQLDFIESPKNLTLKTVLTLKWATESCPQQIPFFMKVNDDVFVNIPNLLHYLLGGTIPLYTDTLREHDRETMDILKPKNRLYEIRGLLVGHLACDVRPEVDVNYIYWTDSQCRLEKIKNSNYLLSFAYVMTTDIVRRLYQVALKTPNYYEENIFLTGIVASKANIPRMHQPLFLNAFSGNLCQLRGSIAQHSLTQEQMTSVYDFVRNHDVHCIAPWSLDIFRLIVLFKKPKCIKCD